MSVRPEVEVAARLASCFQLIDVSLMQLQGRTFPRTTGGEPKDGPSILDWSLEQVRLHWLIDQDDDLRVIVPFRISITRDEHPHARLVLTFRSDYTLRKGAKRPEDDEIDHFVGITGFMHAWPYARAEVQSLTAKLGVLPLTLPVLLSGEVAEKVVVVRSTPVVETGRQLQLPTSAGESTTSAKRRGKKRAS